MSGPQNAELQEALLELQQYLSDNVPPLVVADSVSILMKYPPQAVLPTIRGWTAGQYRGGSGSGVPVSDYLFHALKKIHMMAEFKLVAAEPMNAYLGQLKQAVMALCPEEDRQILSENLGRLGELATTTVSPVTQIHRQSVGAGAPMASAAAPKGAPAGAAAASDTAAVAGHALQGLKRVGLLLERLEAQGGLTITGPGVGGGLRWRDLPRRRPRRWPSPRAARSPAKSSSRRSRASRPSGSRPERAICSARSPSRSRAGSPPSASARRGRAPRPTRPGRSAPCGASSRPPRTRSRRRAAFTRWSRRASTASTRAPCRRRSRCWSSPSVSSPRKRWTRAAPRSPAASSARLSTGNGSRSSPSRRPTRPRSARCCSSSRRSRSRASSTRSRASPSATAGGSCCFCSRSTARPRATEATSG